MLLLWTRKDEPLHAHSSMRKYSMHYKLNSKQKIPEFGKKNLVMGILNITPDSFSDGGMYDTQEKAIERVKQMIHEGADIIDIGGESTRPGAKTISEDQERKRVIPVIKEIKKEFGNTIILSIDTYKAGVAKQALENGVAIVNSLGGFLFDKSLAPIIKQYSCPIIIYHIKGKPHTMQQDIIYDDIIKDIVAFFDEQIRFGSDHGIERKQFLLDPGIGFGKTVEQNIEIIKRLHEFRSFNRPILIGVSRKSHLAKILQEDLSLATLPSPTDRIEASLAETAVAVLHGANIIRTHDVLQTKKFLAILNRLQ